MCWDAGHSRFPGRVLQPIRVLATVSTRDARLGVIQYSTHDTHGPSTCATNVVRPQRHDYPSRLLTSPSPPRGPLGTSCQQCTQVIGERKSRKSCELGMPAEPSTLHRDCVARGTRLRLAASAFAARASRTSAP